MTRPLTSEEAYEFRECEWFDDPALAYWLAGKGSFRPSIWRVTGKGNLHCRDFGCTYTLVSTPDGVRAVVGSAVDKSIRLDLGPFKSVDECLEALWPLGALRPIQPQDKT